MKKVVFPPLPQEDLENIVKKTHSELEMLRGSKIFITGATGFFGIWLLESFSYANKVLNLGANVVALTRDSEKFYKKHPHIISDSSIKFHCGDIRDFSYPIGDFKYLIHAATAPHARISDLEMLETIIQGTKRTLEFAAKRGVEKYLYISSGAVYGTRALKKGKISEDSYLGPDLANPKSAYSEGKRVGELLCAIAHKEYGICTNIARCFSIVGPCLPINSNYAVGNFINNLINNEVITVYNGSARRGYLYASELTIWLWKILISAQACRPYNVGSDKSQTLAKWAEVVSKITNKKINVRISNKTNNEKDNYTPNINKAKRELKLTPEINFHESILKTYNWYNNIKKIIK